MAIRLNPYLNFKDNAREAMTFYHSILGGDITFSTFGESNLSEDPAEQDKIMHSMITAPDGMVLMGSDTPGHMDSSGGPGSGSLRGIACGLLPLCCEQQ